MPFVRLPGCCITWGCKCNSEACRIKYSTFKYSILCYAVKLKHIFFSLCFFVSFSACVGPHTNWKRNVWIHWIIDGSCRIHVWIAAGSTGKAGKLMALYWKVFRKRESLWSTKRRKATKGSRYNDPTLLMLFHQQSRKHNTSDLTNNKGWKCEFCECRKNVLTWKNTSQPFIIVSPGAEREN